MDRNQLSVGEAGRKGGLVVLRKHGRDHFVRIGRRGQQSMRRRYPGMAAEWGRLGGRPRKESLNARGQEGVFNKEGADPPGITGLPPFDDE